MPVEIKELVIRAVITRTHDPTESSAPSAGPSFAVRTGPTLDGEALVKEAVKEVLRILKAARER